MPGWVLRLGGIDWRWRAAASLVFGTALGTAVLAAAGIWQRPGLVVAAALVLAGCVTAPLFRRSRRLLARMDWRIAAILIATAGSIAATLLGFDRGFDRGTAGGFARDVFAGWVAGVGFFGLVGVVVAVVSLVRPENEGFESRARILFRGQDGRHIHYIVDRIRETLEHYAELVVETVAIADYDDAERKFLLRTEARTVLRSYLDDIRTTYSSRIAMEGVADPPIGKAPNRLVHLAVGAKSFGSRAFQDGTLSLPIDTVIEAGSWCEIVYAMEYWVCAETEPNTYAPVRYTQKVRLALRNDLPGNRAVQIRMSGGDLTGQEACSLRPGEIRVACEADDVRPGMQVYDFRILPLT